MSNADKPAYPFVPNLEGTMAGPEMKYGYEGLSKREMFAMAAMQGLVKDIVYQDSVTGEIHGCDFVAKTAIKMADELLKELDKE